MARLGDRDLAVATGASVVLLAQPYLLGSLSAAGLLFPIAAWLALRIWRKMQASRLPMVRAGADVVLSLVLGTVAVLALVWAANLLAVPPAEIAALKAVVAHFGALLDLPWWAWTTTYGVLALATVVLVLRAPLLPGARRRLVEGPLVPGLDAVRRFASGITIGLLTFSLVGLAAPAAVKPGLQSQIQARYAAVLNATLQARGQQAVYDQLSAWAPSHAGSQQLSELAAIIGQIHRAATDDGAAPADPVTERELARRIGRLQAAALALQLGARSDTRPAATAVSAAGEPLRGSTGVRRRLDDLENADRQRSQAMQGAERAGALTATTLATVLQIPSLGLDSVTQIIRECLGNLLEDSFVKDLVAARVTARAPGHGPETGPPLPAENLLDPDPRYLKRAAADALSRQLRHTPPADSATVDERITWMEQEDPIAATIDLANQARYLEQGDGPCAGCVEPRQIQERVNPPEEDLPRVP